MDDEIRMDNQVEWLCYDLISEGLLTAEQCHEVVQSFEQDGECPDLETFARAVIDNGLFTDAERMKALVAHAVQQAEEKGAPPWPAHHERPTRPAPANTRGREFYRTMILAWLLVIVVIAIVSLVLGWWWG